MLPERVPEQLDRVWMVAHWKWELDPDTPWYRRFFFKCVFRPLLHFSWRVMRIPCPKGVEVEGNKCRVFWFENGGFFTSEDAADLACINENHGYKDVPLDRRFPLESAQYTSLVFPRQKNPRQHRKTPTFSLVITPQETLERVKELERQVKELRRIILQ